MTYTEYGAVDHLADLYRPLPGDPPDIAEAYRAGNRGEREMSQTPPPKRTPNRAAANQGSNRQTKQNSNGHGQDTAHQGPPLAVTVRLSEVAPEAVSWLWPGHLPAGKLVTIDGDPGTGKSTLSVEIAAHVTTGSAWPDATACPRGDVVILSAEDGMADTIRPRLDAAGGDPARVHCLTGVRTGTTDDDDREITRPPTLADVDTIRDVIERTGARLLVVDVLMAYLPGRVDSHRDQDVRAVLHRVAEIAEATGCCVLLLRHLNKSGVGSPIYRGGGSIGIVGAARAGYVVAPDPDDDTVRVLAPLKANLAAMPPSLRYRLETAPGSHVARVVWDGESAHAAAALLAPGESDDDRTERDDAAAWMGDYLARAGGAAPARDVLTAGRREGYSRSTLYRAADRLKIKKSKDGMRGGWTWRHPDDGPTRPEDPAEGAHGPTPREVRPLGPSRDLRVVSPPSEETR